MSFMVLAGKRCICKTCGTQIIVEYKGGAQCTQIGEMGIWKQQELREKYESLIDEKVNKTSNFVGEYLIVEEGICQKCFEKFFIDPSELQKWQNLWRIEELNEQIRLLVNEYDLLLNKLLDSIYIQWLSEISLAKIDQVKYQEIIHDPEIRIKGRLKSLLNNYVMKMQKTFITALEKECEKRKEPAFSQMLSQCNEQIRPINAEISCLEKIIGTEAFVFLRDINQSIAENLNSVICYEGSIRVPIAGHGTQYYLEYRYTPPTESSEIFFSPKRNLPPSFYPKEFEKSILKIFVEEIRNAVLEDINIH